MSRALLILLVLFASCGPNSGQSIYLKEINEDRIVKIMNDSVSSVLCNIDGKIWYRTKNRFYYKMLNSVVILDGNCKISQELDFDGYILDFAATDEYLIVSTTKDEVEIYESKLIQISLDNFERKSLDITELGAKYSLCISDDGNLISFVHQDVRLTKQELKVLDLRTNEINLIDKIVLKDGFYSHKYTPSNSDWLNNYLYFTKQDSETSKITLLRHNYVSNENEVVFNYDKKYSQYFQVQSSHEILFYKRSTNRFKQLVSYNTKSKEESILYESDGFLSDLIPFHIEKDK